jgi:membrane associated rhomboid family serine protease
MGRLTPIVKNLLLINVIVFAVTYLFGFIKLNEILGLYYFASPNFYPFQFFTYMFAHGGMMHLLFNMLGLFFLGPLLEQFWGSQKFLIFYLTCGLGAGLIYTGIAFTQLKPMENAMISYEYNPNPDEFYRYISKYYTFRNASVYNLYEDYYDHPNNVSLEQETKAVVREVYNLKLDIPMVGASGAIYGLLMAIALLFPNTQFMLLFPPIPIKAKYLALILGGIALYSGFSNNPGDNVAHFAHLGGMIFAFILIKIWQKDRNRFY